MFDEGILPQTPDLFQQFDKGEQRCLLAELGITEIFPKGSYKHRQHYFKVRQSLLKKGCSLELVDEHLEGKAIARSDVGQYVLVEENSPNPTIVIVGRNFDFLVVADGGAEC